jgi:hypothetical protein
LAETQASIVSILRSVTRSIVGKESFKAIYPRPEDFTIPWADTIGDLNGNRLSDAFKWYTAWAEQEKQPNYVDPQPVKFNNFKKRVWELFPDDDDDEGDRPQKLTRPKDCKSCIFSDLTHPTFMCDSYNVRVLSDFHKRC